MSIVDTHCHLNFHAFDKDWRAVADEAVQQGVSKMVVVGSELENSKRAVWQAASHPACFAAVGLHPTHILDETLDLGEYERLGRNPRVVAIGEIGLDQFRPSERESFEKQKNVFRSLLTLARTLNKPAIIHCRAHAGTLDTYEELVSQLSSMKDRPQFVVHCFMGSVKIMEELIALGGLISFTAVITLPSFTEQMEELLRAIPMERIMLETDSPYIKPHGWALERNTPAGVWEVAQQVARVKGVTVAAVARATAERSEDFFRFH
jgi:TatD DNase family protein